MNILTLYCLFCAILTCGFSLLIWYQLKSYSKTMRIITCILIVLFSSILVPFVLGLKLADTEEDQI